MSGIAHPSGMIVTPIGYPKLAERIANYPNLASFRMFAALNARNILYFQAELLELEKELRQVEADDQALFLGGSRDNYAASWIWLSGGGRNNPNTTQLQLVKRLRGLLYDYSQSLPHNKNPADLYVYLDNALIQQKTIMAFLKPGRNSVRALSVFAEQDLRDRIIAIKPVWGKTADTTANDLISLSDAHHADAFSNFVVDKVIQWLHEHVVARLSRQTRKENPWTEYNAEKWLRCARSVITAIACLLPVLFIGVLSSVHTTKWQLLAIGFFNFLTSVCLDVFTTAKRVEIFAVTAA